MLYKQFRFSLSAFALVALAACSSAPAQPRVSVTVTGQTEATFISTEPLVYTHSSPEAPTTIFASSDAGDYTFSIDVSTLLQAGVYPHGDDYSEGRYFNTLLYTCANPPGCNGLAGSSGGRLIVTRSGDVISGELTVSLRGLSGGDYGEATATFTVPPARVVP